MTVELEKLVAKIEADASDLRSELKRAQEVAERSSSKIQRSLTKIKSVGAGAAKSIVSLKGALLALGAAGALRGIIKAATEQENALAQVEARIKQTGGAAGYTTAQLSDMAKALQDTTTFGDETTLAMQNVLLTFTAIRGPQFKEATKVIQDMSIVMGQDLKQTAIQVGKALNDPILGVTALQRVGVQLSNEQKILVKRLVDTGHAAQAQNIILGELKREFGGAAEAAKTTFGGALEGLKNAFGDLFEASKSEGLQTATDAINKATSVLSDPSVQQAIQSFAAGVIIAFAKAVKYAARLFANVRELYNFIAEHKLTGTGATGDTGLAAQASSLKDYIRQLKQYSAETKKSGLPFLSKAPQVPGNLRGQLPAPDVTKGLDAYITLLQKKSDEFTGQLRASLGDQADAIVKQVYGPALLDLNKGFDDFIGTVQKKLDSVSLPSTLKSQISGVLGDILNVGNAAFAKEKPLKLKAEIDPAVVKANADKIALLAKDLTDRQLTQLDRLHSKGIVSEKEYYDKRAKLEKDQLRVELDNINRQIALQQELSRKPGTSPQDIKGRQTAQAKLIALEGTQAVALRDLADVDKKTSQERQDAQDALRAKVVDVTATLLEQQGKLAAATALRLAQQNKELHAYLQRNKLAQADETLSKTEALKVAQASVNEQQQKAALVKEVLATKEKNIQNLLDAHVITEEQAIEMYKKADSVAIPKLQKIADAWKAVAESANSDQLKAGVAAFQAEIDSLNVHMETLTSKTARDMAASIASGFEEAIVSGKSLRDVLKGIEQDLIRIFTKKLVTNPLENFLTGAIQNSNIFGSIGLGHKALGGNVFAGAPQIVGERGPELFVPRMSGSVIPNNKMFSAGGGTSNVFHINIQAPQGQVDPHSVSQMQAMLYQWSQRGGRNL